VHGASAEDVDVQVVDGLTTVVSGVDNQAEAVGKFAFGEGGGLLEQMAKDVSRGFGDVGVMAPGDQEPVRRRLRVDVGECQRMLVFVDGFDWNLVAGDLAEEAVWHGSRPISQNI
jgi:hypothetical protein